MNAPVKDNYAFFSIKRVPFLFLVILFLLVSCSAPTIVSLTNSSTLRITILIKNRENITQAVVIEPNKNAEIVSLLDKHFSIRRQSDNLNYEVELVPERFIKQEGIGPFLKRVASAHFENDTCIYLDQPRGNRKSQDDIAQPSGFPLCPRNRPAAKHD